jgi:hypothetical protein
MSIDPSNIANPATIGSVAQPIGRRCLVINADDLGFSQQVNAAIDQALARGWISSSTLMANAPCCEEGVAVAQRHRSHASFGISRNSSPLPRQPNCKDLACSMRVACFLDRSAN